LSRLPHTAFDDIGGTVVHLLKRTWAPSLEKAALLALLYAATIPACLWLLVWFPFEIQRLPLYFIAPLVPFFLAGTALSMVSDLHRATAGSLYFADLLGASLGAVVVTVLLQMLGGEGSLLVAAIAPVGLP
jgi:uncharacterized membrane protein YeaQ/YmgE (transglycosylase-associated protein family)